MKGKYVLVPPEGIQLDIASSSRELHIALENAVIEAGPTHCQIKGKIYNTVDPVESALAEGDCLSRIHHPMTPKWVVTASRIIFAPVILLTAIHIMVSQFSLSLSGSFSEFLLFSLITLVLLVLLGFYWLVFVSGPIQSNKQTE